MNLTRRAVLVLSLAALARPALAAPPDAQGLALAQVLDSLDVEQKWIAGAHVDWQTGLPTGDPLPLPAHHTHCSAFVAAAAQRLGVYILRPPEHGQTLLSNAQAVWLAGPGQAQGWRALPDGATAQAEANRGLLVVATYENPDPTTPGHVAIVRPNDSSPAKLAAEGPELTMAGIRNWRKITAKAGFANHPGAFAGNLIRYWDHDIPPGALAN